jgi:hypothetical protein
MPEDLLAAGLAAIRERSDRPLPHPGGLPVSHPAVQALMESAADVPLLLAVVDAALAYHRPVQITRNRTGCLTEGGTWPCGHYEAMTRAMIRFLPGARLAAEAERRARAAEIHEPPEDSR